MRTATFKSISLDSDSCSVSSASFHMTSYTPDILHKDLGTATWLERFGTVAWLERFGTVTWLVGLGTEIWLERIACTGYNSY